MTRVAVLDYGMGNLRSVAKALDAAGARAHVTSDAAAIDACDALCIPGQGIFGRCMVNLEAAGLAGLVRRWIGDGRPYLGICLGMQILYEGSEEADAPGLGILAGKVTRLPSTVRVPHIGWNVVGTGPGARHYYFDHSYAVDAADESTVAGWCTHGRRFAAWVEAGPVTAVQFHPEKSSRSGIALLEQWLSR